MTTDRITSISIAGMRAIEQVEIPLNGLTLELPSSRNLESLGKRP
jgi:hypothetical protein